MLPLPKTTAFDIPLPDFARVHNMSPLALANLVANKILSAEMPDGHGYSPRLADVRFCHSDSVVMKHLRGRADVANYARLYPVGVQANTRNVMALALFLRHARKRH